MKIECSLSTFAMMFPGDWGYNLDKVVGSEFSFRGVKSIYGRINEVRIVHDSEVGTTVYMEVVEVE